jgi:mono/diheme cytochrome c family protein
LNPVTQLKPDLRGALQERLAEYFGKPAEPTVKGVSPKDLTKLANSTSAGDTEFVEALDSARLGFDPETTDIPVTLQIGDETLKKGSALYRRYCLHCHGLTGNGRGPTAPWVNPHPRDYRQGIFKFVSTNSPGRKPSREDLLRVLRQGVDGTSMPAFGAISGNAFTVLPEDELKALTSYVIHLSIRGQVEFEIMAALAGKRAADIVPISVSVEPTVDAVKAAVPRWVVKVAMEWVKAAAPEAQIDPAKLVKVDATEEEIKRLRELAKSAPTSGKKEEQDAWREELLKVLTAKPYTEADIRYLLRGHNLVDDITTVDKVEGLIRPDEITSLAEASRMASVERGHELFRSVCLSCHEDYGRKDNLKWDNWGTIVRPANLTLGLYRGGRRPIDLYWRINGIPGAAMPNNAQALATVDLKIKGHDGKEVEVPKEPWRLWDVVNFVQAVPHRSMLPRNVLDRIYPHNAGE